MEKEKNDFSGRMRNGENSIGQRLAVIMGEMHQATTDIQTAMTEEQRARFVESFEKNKN